MNWRKSLISLLAIILLFAAAFGLNKLLSSFAKPSEEKAREEIKLFVKTKKVNYSANDANIVETGRLASQQTVDLSAEVQGGSSLLNSCMRPRRSMSPFWSNLPLR